MPKFFERSLLKIAILAAELLLILPNISTELKGDEELIYHAEFEVDQGYDPVYILGGQGTWMVEGTAGNGLIEGYFNDYGDFGNQAYIGAYSPENEVDKHLIAWPMIEGLLPFDKKFRFSVAMMIIDSENEKRDFFQWSIFNKKAKPILTVDFNNQTKNISYIIGQHGEIIKTGFVFDNNVLYDLEINIDLELGIWALNIGGETVVSNKEINLTDVDLDFGDIDAIWIFGNPDFPGDNFMVFDDYKVYVDRSLPKFSDIELESVYGAVRNNDINLVTNYLSSGLDSNTKLNYWSLLGWAVFNNKIDIVKLLLDSGANVNLLNKEGLSPIAIAVDMGYNLIVDILIKNNADLGYFYPDGENLLTRATKAGRLEIVQILVKFGLDADSKNKKEQSSLHIASYYGLEEVANFLLDHDVDINLKDNAGKTSLDYCILGDHTDLVKRYEHYINMQVIYHDSEIQIKVKTLIPRRYIFGYNVPVKNVNVRSTTNLSEWIDYDSQPNKEGVNEFTVKITDKQKEFFSISLE